MPPTRRQYDLARHHAWGGLGMLALAAVLRGVVPGISPRVAAPVLGALCAYAGFWLFLTYRYRAALGRRREEAAGGAAARAKAEAKAAKKQAKAAAKAAKKGGGGGR